MKNQSRQFAKYILFSLLLIASFSLLSWVTNPALKASAAGTAATLARDPYPIDDAYPPPTVVTITAIEVIQVTQDRGNPVPLIARKPTVAKVAVECGADIACHTLRNEIVHLSGFDESNDSLGASLAPVASQSSLVGKAFSFQLPQSWSSGQKILKVKIGAVTQSKSIEFAEAQALHVLMAPIHYQYGGLDKTPNLVRVFNGHWWAARVLPTADLTIVESQAPLLWTDGCLGTDCTDPALRQTQSAKLLLQLERLRTVYNHENGLQGGNQAAFVYGWLPAGIEGGSYAPLNETAAFGDDDPQVGAQIFAHAFGHLLGRPYTKAGPPESCGNPAPLLPSDWPTTYPDATIQTWGLDATALVWKDPALTYDYMSHCWLPGEGQGAAWTSPHTYRQIFLQKLSASLGALAAQSLEAAQPGLRASGVIFNDGRAQLYLQLPGVASMQSEYPPTGTAYCLEAQNNSGTALAQRCFDLSFLSPETGATASAERFQLNLAYPSGVARIVLKKGSHELAVQAVSTHAPEVTILSPNGGESWPATGGQTITWQANDADGDGLTYHVLYGLPGHDWVPLALGISDTHLVVNPAELAGGSGASIRVVASDGVHIGVDESDAPFTVERKAPQSLLLSPTGNQSSSPSELLLLHGQAYDLEDQTLEGTAFRWTSTINGDLGTGDQLNVTLSAGNHLITLTATDGDGNVTTKQVNVVVAHKVYLPSIQR